jgi:hypothetical protein
MKRMSFSITTRQFRARTKTVTRRVGWENLRRGEIVMGIEKGMGLKKGEKQVELGKIEIVSNRPESLALMIADPRYGKREAIKEGFPEMSGRQFVRMFCQARKCQPEQRVQRIEYRYL